ncbi:hypothetical protein [Symmachiella dynata]|nr:hypothetical protein [Symmachiella dynata]
MASVGSLAGISTGDAGETLDDYWSLKAARRVIVSRGQDVRELD